MNEELRYDFFMQQSDYDELIKRQEDGINGISGQIDVIFFAKGAFKFDAATGVRIKGKPLIPINIEKTELPKAKF